MCGIVGIVGNDANLNRLQNMLSAQAHRGPDSTGTFNLENIVSLGHNRLSIIDLSNASNQPFGSADNRYYVVFNGEIYNYLEIKKQLENDFDFHTTGDTEVLLNAYIKWGADCLEKLIGMFSFVIWDNQNKSFFAARDRLGVKPFYYHISNNGSFYFASEIKSIFAAGVEKVVNNTVWANYLSQGSYDNSIYTFWENIIQLESGHYLTIIDGQLEINRYYYLFDKTGEDFDPRPIEEVREEYFSILQDTIKLRFRADVPVGINISGGLDSSALLAMVNNVQGQDSHVKAFSFYTNDNRYDELPWVEQMISKTKHPLEPVLLTAKEIPDLAQALQNIQDEPYGGIPTIAYSQIFKSARAQGIIVLLDGQGMDEQWAGYDYYRNQNQELNKAVIQGSKDNPFKTSTLSTDFSSLSTSISYPTPYNDNLSNLQYRDAFYTKIPRALRFNDRVSMMYSTELREPFLDLRLFELAFKQRSEYKIDGNVGKYFMRELLKTMLPGNVVEAPKRPLQTPQREWLKNELKDWAYQNITLALASKPEWFNKEEVWNTWDNFQAGKSDNSFYIWQWITIGLMKV